MKLPARVLLVAALWAQAGLLAQAFAAGPSLAGAWAVDTSRLPQPPQARPQSVTITFAPEGADRWRAHVQVVDPAGNTLQAEGVTPLDGTPTRIEANFEADMSATTMPRPEVLVMQLAKGGSPASTRIYTLAPEGDRMIETVAYFDADGRPVLRRNFFTRLR